MHLQALKEAEQIRQKLTSGIYLDAMQRISLSKRLIELEHYLFLEGEPVSSIKSGIIQPDEKGRFINAAREWYRKWLEDNNHTQEFENDHIGTVIIAPSGIKAAMSHAAKSIDLQGLPALPEAITKARLLSRTLDDNGKPIENIILAAPINIDDVKHYMAIRLRKHTEDKKDPPRFYTTAVTVITGIKKEYVPQDRTTGQENLLTQNGGRTRLLNILYKALDVNFEDTDEDKQLDSLNDIADTDLIPDFALNDANDYAENKAMLDSMDNQEFTLKYFKEYGFYKDSADKAFYLFTEFKNKGWTVKKIVNGFEFTNKLVKGERKVQLIKLSDDNVLFIRINNSNNDFIAEFGTGSKSISNIISLINESLNEDHQLDSLKDQNFIDQAANEAATSPKNDLPEPTEEQKINNDYKTGDFTILGLKICIENPEGSVRSGTKADGETWSITLKSHYGYIDGTHGIDGDEIDCFVKPGIDDSFEGQIYIIDQVDKEKNLDEHKIIIGADSEEEAKQMYLSNYRDGWDGLGNIRAVSIDQFKQMLRPTKVLKFDAA